MEDVWGEDGARGGVSYKKNKRRLAVRLGKRNRQGFMGEEDCIKGIQMLSPDWPKIPWEEIHQSMENLLKQR